MIYCDSTLSVCTGRNLSVRVDRSTEVVGWHTMPDASNYISVSVRGPPSFALYENNERRKSTRGRLRSERHRSARLQPRPAFHTQPTASSYIHSYYEAVNLHILRRNLYLTGKRAIFSILTQGFPQVLEILSEFEGEKNIKALKVQNKNLSSLDFFCCCFNLKFSCIIVLCASCLVKVTCVN